MKAGELKLEYTNIGGRHGTVNDYMGKKLSESSLDLTRAVHYEACTWLQFPPEASWTAENIEINDRQGRRMVCVLAQDRLHYRIYDLDDQSHADV